MTLGLHNLQAAPGGRRKRTRIGRGNATGSGTYSGRGQKGQRSRSGGRSGLKILGLAKLLQNKPKLGGFKSNRPQFATVTTAQIEQKFNDGEQITPKRLVTVELIDSTWPGVKVLGSGKMAKKLTISANAFSESAKQAILDAGGNVLVLPVGEIKPKKTKSKDRTAKR